MRRLRPTGLCNVSETFVLTVHSFKAGSLATLEIIETLMGHKKNDRLLNIVDKILIP